MAGILYEKIGFQTKVQPCQFHAINYENCSQNKNLSTSYLRKATNIAPNTMTKLQKHEDDFLTVLCRICEALDADIGDVMEFTLEREGVD